jgi:hypothetical protein
MNKLDDKTKKLMIEFARHCMIELVSQTPPGGTFSEISSQNLSKITKILNEKFK